MSKLILERKRQSDDTTLLGGGGARLMITPPINEGYWSYRVKLRGDQAIVGFPKFGTIGIGFAIEADDWNVNLPFDTPTEKIYQHIRRNKGDSAIRRETVISAIRLVQAGIIADGVA